MQIPSSDFIRYLAPYLSRTQLRRIATQLGPRADPGYEEHLGAILFIDISGFTALTQQLSMEGPWGAETLSEILNVVFGQIITLTRANGGDALIFAGDSLTVAFEATAGVDLSQAICLAAQSALALRGSLTGMEPRPGQPLHLRMSIGAGHFSTYEVGGIEQRWFQIVAGPALSQAYRSDKLAKPGAIMVSSEAWGIAGSRMSGELAEGRAWRLHAVLNPEPPHLEPEPMLELSKAPLLASYVAPVVGERMTFGHGHFVAEFRAVSLMFANLPGLSLNGESSLGVLQHAMEVMQSHVARFGGTAYQMLSDEKGTSFLAGFGMPPRSQGDDAVRAAETARAIEQVLDAEGVRVSIGIATGNLFCGAYGPPVRRNYALMGTTINRSARLMQALMPQGGVLCDETTRDAATRMMEFEALPPISLKGLAEPVAVFRPRKRHKASTSPRMIGRAQELEMLTKRLGELRSEPLASALVIEAEPGMGKSTLLERLPELAAQQGVRLLSGQADSLESHTAYYPFRAIVRALFGLDEEVPPSEARRKVLSQLAEEPMQAELAPLLNAVLPLDLPDNESTRQMVGQIRSENLSQLLRRLIIQEAQRAPVVISIEDVHWMDCASWLLCAQIVHSSVPLFFVLTTRPVDVRPAEWSFLVERPRGSRIVLKALKSEEIIELVKRRLGVTSMPAVVKEIILNRSEGNPFFSEELAVSLHQQGVVEVVGRECLVRSEAAALSHLALPGTVQGLLTSRIDRLPPPLQLCLKVASVVGRTFEPAIVENIYPVETERARISEHISLLAQECLLQPKGRIAYGFRHALIHETVYSTLPYAQRKVLHRLAGEYIERVYAEELSAHYARLAFHWSVAEIPDKAIRYLSLAAAQALDAYDNQAAIDLSRKALALDEKLRGPLVEDLQRARWHRHMAEAYYSLAQHDVAREHYERAIQLCGFPRPRFGLQTLLELGQHVYRRHVPNKTAPSPDLRERCIEALQAAENLQIIHLWQGDMTSLAHTVLEATNIATLAGPSPESAVAIGAAGYLMMMGQMRGVGERDMRASVAMANASGQLLARVATHMKLGLTCSLLGQSDEAYILLEQADALAEKLGAGLWKHRGKFMLAEHYLLVGDCEKAAEIFGAAAALAAGAEASVVGYASAMKALCRLRSGRVEEALSLVEGPCGIQLVRDNPTPIQLYVCLGAEIEAHLENGTLGLAVPLAQEALKLAANGNACNTWMNGHYGHSAVATFYLSLWEQTQAGFPVPGAPDVAVLAQLSRVACRNLKKSQQLFPVVEPRYLLLRGWCEQLAGSSVNAMKLLIRASSLAASMKLPHEQACALYHHGRFSSGNQRVASLEHACQIFERHGMLLDLERARRALHCDGSVRHLPDHSVRTYGIKTKERAELDK